MFASKEGDIIHNKYLTKRFSTLGLIDSMSQNAPGVDHKAPSGADVFDSCSKMGDYGNRTWVRTGPIVRF